MTTSKCSHVNSSLKDRRHSVQNNDQHPDPKDVEIDSVPGSILSLRLANEELDVVTVVPSSKPSGQGDHSRRIYD